jgi:hypothetical protein
MYFNPRGLLDQDFFFLRKPVISRAVEKGSALMFLYGFTSY